MDKQIKQTGSRPGDRTDAEHPDIEHHAEEPEHEGATEEEIGDLTGPGAGYDIGTSPAPTKPKHKRPGSELKFP